MIRFWSRRRPRASRASACAPNASTPFLNWINALGPHIGLSPTADGARQALAAGDVTDARIHMRLPAQAPSLSSIHRHAGTMSITPAGVSARSVSYSVTTVAALTPIPRIAASAPRSSRARVAASLSEAQT